MLFTLAPPPPATPATLVFEDKRQLIIKQLTLSFSHPVSVSSSRREGGLIFNDCHPRHPEGLPVCVYVVYRNKMWGRDSDQHICFSSSWQQLYDVFITQVIIIIIPYSNPLIKQRSEPEIN